MFGFRGGLPLLFLLLVALASFPCSLFSSPDCSRTCGSITVPFPFGFSEGCEITLNCTRARSEIRVGEFQVRNITPDILLVDVPPRCDRPVHAVASLFGKNYALTSRNGLFLRHCTTSSSGCLIPTSLLSREDLNSCGDSARCFSDVGSTGGFLAAKNITTAGCSSLFTSIGFEPELESQDPHMLPLVLQSAVVEWWREGGCRCSPHAKCTNFTSPSTGKPGFRCKCLGGFQGDGFADGARCKKVTDSKCNPSKYISGSCGGTARVAVLIGGIVAGAFIMAGVVLVCYLIRRRSSFSRIRKSTKRLLSEASCTVPLYPYKDIEKATDAFSESQRLGTGAYGTVYAGKLGNDKLVAIKKIKHRDADGIVQVMNEIKLLSSVSHPNLVRLLGCCIERGEQILVYEFMPNGTLAQHLQRERGPALPWTVRLGIAAETAQAIAYLHSAIHPPIYHRDIKSSNILLDFNYKSKVADFGLSRIAMTESSHISTAPQGTPGYLDPQYHQNFHLSDKSDVYSFGVVLVEIITALKAVDFNRVQSEVNLAALAIDKIGRGSVDEIIDPCLDPNRDAWTLSSIHKVAELAFRCLAFHRDMRPSMTEVADELEQIRLSGWAPSADDCVFMSTASSLCSSPSNCTDKSSGVSKSRRLALSDTMVEVKVDSPVSVQEPWFSGQSSPSENSLLGNVVR
ncbi:wall-associated receptor kinase-like 14 [Phoenix dactylifera]|uniref:Wall-associated receptor kinase-like 14 n=1 Tax=Phoenix dactylifera TaxID=42345 RepID=A0A8B7C2B9_PHODC|nr:wall-associated receptor kinase-like 14 [Phoenix dactylifera]